MVTTPGETSVRPSKKRAISSGLRRWYELAEFWLYAAIAWFSAGLVEFWSLYAAIAWFSAGLVSVPSDRAR